MDLPLIGILRSSERDIHVLVRYLRRGSSFAPLAFAACIVASCGSNDGDVTDAGTSDANASDQDANVEDSGPHDADVKDAEPCAAPLVLCDGACVDPMTNVDHCGTCGHACGCGSTSCTQGRCDPKVLADKQGGPYTLLAYNDMLYWGADTDRNLSRVSTDGGDATVLYPGRTAIRGIAANPTTLFFSRTVFNIIEAGPIGGGSGGSYTNAREPGASGIAVDATRVYWANATTGGPIRTTTLAAPTSPSTMIDGQDHPTNLVIDADNIYWTTNVAATGTVMRMSKTGGRTTAVALASKQASPFGLAVDATHVYWTNQGDGTVNKVPIGGGAPTAIATGRKFPFYLAVDANFVYWTDRDAGTVEKAPIGGGGAVTQLAVNQQLPLGLAVDASCVYFAVSGTGAVGTGSIRKASK